MGTEITEYGTDLELPERVEGETVEEYHKFLRYVLMPPGQRNITQVARELGMDVDSVMQLALRRGWVDRARRYDRVRLERLRLEVAATMQEALSELFSAVVSISRRIQDASRNLEIGAHNVAQIMTAMGDLVKAMQSISSSGSEESSSVTLRDVMMVITGAQQATMRRGGTSIEIVTGADADVAGSNERSDGEGPQIIYSDRPGDEG